MNPEGRLDIRLGADPGQPARIASVRPVHASRLFEGQTPAETALTLPRLFSVCALAQTVAFSRAVESATRARATGAVERHRETLVGLETLREHLWRVLLDWPIFLDERPQPGRPARLNEMLRPTFLDLNRGASLRSPADSATASASSALERIWPELGENLATAVLGCPVDVWLRISDRDELERWSHGCDTVAGRLIRAIVERSWEDLGRCPITPLPDLPAPALERHLRGMDARRFIAQPSWEKACHETGALARQKGKPLVRNLIRDHGNGLLTRLTARLVELCSLFADLPGQLTYGAPSAATPEVPGLAQVEAARGHLVHRVVLEGERIRDYAILAPTEWNFHRAGVAAMALADAQGEPALRERMARLLISAIDPCVAYRLRLGDEDDAGS